MKAKWVIEGYFGRHDATIQRIPLTSLPVIIGRDRNLALALEKPEVSRQHAELLEIDGQLAVRDLNSSNGTFLNRQKVDGLAMLSHGDILHFASYEARLICEEQESQTADDDTRTTFNSMPLSDRLPAGLKELISLIDQRQVHAMFQPVTDTNGDFYAYELLGRGSSDTLPTSPMPLFRIAESMPGLATQLSEVMRDCGVAQAMALSDCPFQLFVNTHPEELQNLDQLYQSLERLRQQYPALALVLEIHEDGVSNVSAMADFARALKDLNMELAFDDFGAGQSRLTELTNVPVSLVKFDISLIRGLPSAGETKQKMVAALAAMTKSMGIKSLAEGVEDQDELDICARMGFDLIQGYYLGKPHNALDYQNPLRKV